MIDHALEICVLFRENDSQSGSKSSLESTGSNQPQTGGNNAAKEYALAFIFALTAASGAVLLLRRKKCFEQL